MVSQIELTYVLIRIYIYAIAGFEAHRAVKAVYHRPASHHKNDFEQPPDWHA
jgi:hypothetical protein